MLILIKHFHLLFLIIRCFRKYIFFISLMKIVFRGFTKNICLKSCIDEEFRDGKDNKNALIIFWWKIWKSCIFPSLNEQYKKRVIRRGYVVSATKRSCKCLMLLWCYGHLCRYIENYQLLPSLRNYEKGKFTHVSFT